MDYALDTPSSSPPSSPSLCAIDSSPACSPILEPVIVNHDLPAFLSLGHPLAASVKANCTLPQYEQRYPPPFPQPAFERPTKKHRTANEVERESVYCPTFVRSSEHDRQALIWDECITKVVDEGHGTMSLSSQNLSYISTRISELGNFVAIPARSEQVNASLASSAYMAGGGGRLFTRTATAPASTTGDFFSSRTSGNMRTSSIKDVSVGSPREEIQLFLAGNQIRSLPRELFCLQKMTVLIMRNNHLTHLPPEIVQLKSLRELNVSNNQLRCIPSEMLAMKLTQLLLHPNPFLQSPVPPSRSLSRSNSRLTISFDRPRVVSPAVQVQPRVTSLVELSYRILFSPNTFPNIDPFTKQNHAPTLPEETVLSRHELPLGHKQMPPHISSILNTCVPGSVEDEHHHITEVPADEITGLSVCPSPHHGKCVYVKHAEERYSWEEIVAGVTVGGAVPVRWRGCQWGCLDFLDNGSREAGGGGDGQAVAHNSGDVEMDLGEDEMGVVQMIDLTAEDYADFI